MKKMMIATIALIGATAYSAVVRQASQGWVNMRLDEMRQSILAEVSSISSTTSLTTQSATSTDAAASVADAMTIVDFLCSPVAEANTNGTPYYVAGSCSASLTNTLTANMTIPMTGEGVFSTNGVVITEGSATNTLVVGGAYTLTAPSGYTMFTNADGEYAFLFKGYEEVE